MTPEQQEVIHSLRDDGYAVCIWTPEELGDVPNNKAEDRIVELGNEAIDVLQSVYGSSPEADEVSHE